ncbi:MAG: hypothetical protein Q9223_002431 [Gallowayella weberi]
MLGTFDLVHVQNWTLIWRPETCESLIRNLLTLLKPGGFLQWTESDPNTNRLIVAPGSTTPSTEGVEEIISIFNNPRPDINHEWIPRLGEYLSQPNNADLVAWERYPVRKELQMDWNIGSLFVCEELGAAVRKSAKTEQEVAKADTLRGVMEKMAVEMMNGVGIYSEVVVAVVGKK